MTLKKPNSFSHAASAIQAAADKLGQDIRAVDVRKITSLADVFLFVGATSHIHVKALEDAIRENLRHAGAALLRTDGHRGHSWRVLDYGGLIVHIMEQKTREFYGVERLWDDGKKIAVKQDEPKPKKKRERTKKTK